MTKKTTIVRYSLSEVEAIRERGQDSTRPDAPEGESLRKDFWKSARVVMARARPTCVTDRTLPTKILPIN